MSMICSVLKTRAVPWALSLWRTSVFDSNLAEVTHSWFGKWEYECCSLSAGLLTDRLRRGGKKLWHRWPGLQAETDATTNKDHLKIALKEFNKWWCLIKLSKCHNISNFWTRKAIIGTLSPWNLGHREETLLLLQNVILKLNWSLVAGKTSTV